MRRSSLWLAAAVLALGAAAPGLAGQAGARADLRDRQGKLPDFPKTSTRFYDIYSKLDKDALDEAGARLTAMAKHYRRRLSPEAQTAAGKLPIYLFDDYGQYQAAGGPNGTGGIFLGLFAHSAKGSRLVEGHVLGCYRAGETEKLWNVLQHECWHQHAALNGGLNWPIWLNEGLAEYYAEALWTGDDLITGIIPPKRLEEVQSLIKDKKSADLGALLSMDSKKWQQTAQAATWDLYCQVWSLIHFMTHAENKKYERKLEALVREAVQGRPGLESFQKVFGPKYQDIKTECEGWWMTLKPDATRDQYVRATVSTMTSFLARAHLGGRRYQDAEEFFAAAADGKLLATAQTTKYFSLPKALLDRQLEQAQALKEWFLVRGVGGVGYPELRLDQPQPDGTTLIGAFEVQRDVGITVTVRGSASEEVARAGKVGSDPDERKEIKGALRQLEAEAAATGKFEEGRSLETERKVGSAIRAYRECAWRFQGTEGARKATERLDELAKDTELRKKLREFRARKLLARAEAAFANKSYAPAAAAADQILKDFADTEPVEAAKKLRAQLDAEPEASIALLDSSVKSEAERQLRLADGFRRNKMTDKALAEYRKVIERFPKTSYAAAAEKRIQEMTEEPQER